MATLMKDARAFFLFGLGVLLFLVGCGTTKSLDDPLPLLECSAVENPDDQLSPLVVIGKVIMPSDSAGVHGAIVHTTPPSQTRSTDEEGCFMISSFPAGPGTYTFIATITNPHVEEILKGEETLAEDNPEGEDILNGKTTLEVMHEKPPIVYIVINKIQTIAWMEVGGERIAQYGPGDKHTGN